ncbi:DUF488 family protein [Halobaculum halobium]|uniref:DUF488 family protein n=1 Tax=Halobaculum halobium TaxID=3032281 RepID=A0ABD5TCA5_9EURY|nr:DUF488 family protein [Halobaculum sp. SYNS20]
MVLSDTYVAELDRERDELPRATRLIGVAASPSRRLRALVDEVRPGLAPPEPLRADHAEAAASFRIDGLCESGAHNAAWDRVDFADRYRAHLASDSDARAAVESLCETLAAGTDLTLVGDERSGEVRSHRTVLREVLADRAGRAHRGAGGGAVEHADPDSADRND